MASSVGTLHREYGYTYNGKAPIGGLTPMEHGMLILDAHLQQEAMEDEQDAQERNVGHSKSRRSTKELARQRANETKA